MTSSTVYIIMTLIAFAIIAIFTFSKQYARQTEGLSTLASIAFVLVIAGLFFGKDKWIGYGLMGAGIMLSIADIIMKNRAKS